MKAQSIFTAIALLITGCATTDQAEQLSHNEQGEECRPIPQTGLCANGAVKVSGCAPERTTCDEARERDGQYDRTGATDISDVVRGMGMPNN